MHARVWGDRRGARRSPYSTQARRPLLERAKAALRTLLTRRRRPWTRDDLWALVSWLFVGQGLFILAGTTTFASLLLLLANSLQFQDWFTRRLAVYLARSTGMQVAFGDAITPNWRTGRIVFRNVSMRSLPESRGHYSLCDLVIEKMEVTLSMKRLLEGRGLVVSCDASGVRGTIDCSDVHPDAYVGWRHASQPGDFDLENVTLRDVLVTILSPNAFRPYALSIISASLPRLRKRYILYDFLAADSVVGMLDGSLFSMHIPQVVLPGSRQRRCFSMRHLKMHALNVDLFSSGSATGPLSWLTRGSVDLDVFVQLPSNYRHPSSDDHLLDSISSRLGALTENILVEILRESGSRAASDPALAAASAAPHGPRAGAEQGASGAASRAVVERARERLQDMRHTVLRPLLERIRSRLQQDFFNVDDRAMESPEEAALHFLQAKPDTVAFKVDFRFHNLRAHLPWNTDRGLVNTTLMRTLAAYINEQRPFIPLSCHFDLTMDNLDGAWTIYESGIVDAVSQSVADSFELLVADRQKKIRRLKRVSLWSIYAIFRNLRFWMAESGYLQMPSFAHQHQPGYTT